MKIGIVAPGIWNSIHLDMAQALGALGHDVAIYTEDGRAPSGARFLNGVLDQWLVDNRQHLLGGCLGGGQESRAQSGNGKYGLAQRLSHGCLAPLFDMRNHHGGRAKLWQTGKIVRN